MTRRSHGWYGAAVIAGLALVFPTAASASAAIDHSVGQVVAEVNGHIQGLTQQPLPALPTPPPRPGTAPPSRPAPTKPAPAPASAPGAPAHRAAPRSAYVSHPRASSSRPRKMRRHPKASASARTASTGSPRRSAASSDPTDAIAATSPASRVVSSSVHEDGALPFTGLELLQLGVLGLLSLGLGLGLLRTVRNRDPSESKT
jgi:hypothetical protein